MAPRPPQSPKPPSPREGAAAPGDRRALGREAEELAARWLEERGYRILDRNHALRRGELDLVCEVDGVLCFVEVRSRTGEEQGGPEETVGRGKARRVVHAARDWLARNGGEERDVRFDVVAVTFGEGEPRVVHFPAAFDGEGEPWIF